MRLIWQKVQRLFYRFLGILLDFLLILQKILLESGSFNGNFHGGLPPEINGNGDPRLLPDPHDIKFSVLHGEGIPFAGKDAGREVPLGKEYGKSIIFYAAVSKKQNFISYGRKRTRDHEFPAAHSGGFFLPDEVYLTLLSGGS